MGWVVGANKGSLNPLLALLSLLLILNESGILTPAVVAGSNVHIVYMGKRQHEDPKLVTDSHHQILTSVLGSKEAAAESIIYSYKLSFSGFAAKLTVSQAQQIADLPGIVGVMPNRFHKRHTTRSWDYLGISLSHPTSLLQGTNMGDGAIVGVIDSGVWPESKSFSDKGLGRIPSRWKGACEPGEKFDPRKHCNKKLIGARWFVKGLLAENAKDFNSTEFHLQDVFSSRDMDGHGTHCASTAAGSPVDNVSYKGLALGTVRGGAPRARLAIYKVLWNYDGQTTSADILKAFDEAIHDGVDVLSLSIEVSPPYVPDLDDELNPIAIGAFHAVMRGITVVSSAGNSGPVPQTVGTTSPWIISVAASTIDRAFPTVITLGNNMTMKGSAMYTGKEIGFKRLISCDDLNLDQPDNSSIAGSVVLCFLRSAIIGIDSFFFKNTGLVGVIIATSSADILKPSDDFPIIAVNYDLGTQMFQYIRSTRFPVVKLSPSRTFVGKPLPSRIAGFSSRGPSMKSPEILKPDIAAPGVNILAATFPRSESIVNDKGFGFSSGTSMAAPHVAGVVALLKSLYPHWSPAAIRSAMVTTAWTTGPTGEAIFSEGNSRNLANPFDFGGGIINPNRAANPGLIYDMGITDYIHYLCAMGYKNSAISSIVEHPIICSTMRNSILDVNVPSITIPRLTSTITLNRTVTNVGTTNTTYKVMVEPPLGITVLVQPEVLVFSPEIKMLSFMVTISTSYQVNTEFYFGSLTWSDGVHAVRTPISVRTQFTY